MPDEPNSIIRVYTPLVAVAAIVLVVDQVTKEWATGLDKCVDLVERPTVGFCLAHNEGMAFSFGWGSGPIIAGVAVLIVGALLFSARKVPLGSRLLMGAIAGGALGNVLDRGFRAPAPGSTNSGFMSGAVVDFLYSSFWATFNIADTAIVVGGLLLAVALWRLPDPETDPDVASPDGVLNTGASAPDADTDTSTITP